MLESQELLYDAHQPYIDGGTMSRVNIIAVIDIKVHQLIGHKSRDTIYESLFNFIVSFKLSCTESQKTMYLWDVPW